MEIIPNWWGMSTVFLRQELDVRCHQPAKIEVLRLMNLGVEQGELVRGQELVKLIR